MSERELDKEQSLLNSALDLTAPELGLARATQTEVGCWPGLAMEGWGGGGGIELSSGLDTVTQEENFIVNQANEDMKYNIKNRKSSADLNLPFI